MSRLDPDVERLVELGRQAGKPPFEALSPEQARAAYAASWDALQPPAVEVASVQDITIALGGADAGTVAADGAGLRLRVYRPAGSAAAERLPCMVFLHGGGWVLGNLESHDRLCRRLANLSRSCFVAVDYRLAPEHPFPAAVDDSLAALRWVAEHADTLHIDASRLAVGGDSAGGNLAAVLALMARDGDAPPLMYQALLYPVLDLAAATESYRTVAGVPLTADTMQYFIAHYAPHAPDRADWRTSPLKAASLAGLPPALVVTVSHDPLCDEGRDYAARLEAEGGRVTALHLSDHMHGMLMHGKLVRASNVVVEVIGTLLRDALHHAPAAGGATAAA